MRRGWIVAAVLFAGCGSGEAESEKPAAATATPTRAATAEATPTTDPFSDQAAADLATEYVAALEEGDWGKACSLHARRLRQMLAAAAGGCEAGIEEYWQENRKLRKHLITTSAGEVRRRGGRAIVEYTQTFAPKLGVNFVAVKERGRWRLADFQMP